MNPNAKEFVPAHLLKKRADEAVGDLTKQIGNVGLDESKKNTTTRGENGDSSCNNKTSTASSTTDKNNSTSSPASDANDKDQQTPSEAQRQQHNTANQDSNRSSNNSHHNTNGDSMTPHLDDDDRHLLRAGENYCEFNGEQFIIPGEDDDEQYEGPGSDNPPHPSYDFGNAEDNEDEDVCNAYEEFLNELP